MPTNLPAVNTTTVKVGSVPILVFAFLAVMELKMEKNNVWTVVVAVPKGVIPVQHANAILIVTVDVVKKLVLRIPNNVSAAQIPSNRGKNGLQMWEDRVDWGQVEKSAIKTSNASPTNVARIAVKIASIT